ncbi:aminomethyl-transferring glycine dehydrogenase subunit GcvPA [Magnetococcales bacterium HHB-1]
MPYIPHTETDVTAMLKILGISSLDDLFEEIPQELHWQQGSSGSLGMLDREVARLMRARAQQDEGILSFLGGGAYAHHVPDVVWALASRGEFYSAYTPYQAEASQGMLQTIYEFQSMISRLTGMDLANASLYDGATALAEAVLMAVRQGRGRNKTIAIPKTVHPHYRQVVRTLTEAQGIELLEIDFDPEKGVIDPERIEALHPEPVAVVVPQPNFFGNLEDVDALSSAAHKIKAQVIALVNPLALAVLKPPGLWGERGADIVCGEGQPLGIPLSSGGPYLGFLACKKSHMRQIPGRLVGRTVDLEGKEGFVLTLQAREQHIRRSRATSNICTNQGLMAVVAAMYMTLMGDRGLREVAAACHTGLNHLIKMVEKRSGMSVLFEKSHHFHEVVLQLSKPADMVIEAMAKKGIAAGIPLSCDDYKRSHALLVCVTELHTGGDLMRYLDALEDVLLTEV